MRTACWLAGPIFVACSIANAGDWPAWRGPDHNGITSEPAPLTWSRTENIRWKAALPEPGNSTPIISGDHVFLTQALDGGKRRALVALHRADGRKFWQRDLPCSTVETTHKQNPPCSASPITDGQAVYAHFASAGVVAFDFQGKELWRRDLGPVLHKWGNGGSPILYKNLLIVTHGPGEPTFLIALDKRNGETAWKRDEPAINSPVFGSWSTPVVLKVNGRDELVMPFATELPSKTGSPYGEGEFKGYDPASGKELWRCKGLGSEIYAMPIVSAKHDLIVGISGHNGPLLAIRPGGNGDVTGTHRVWRQADKNPQRIGCGVIHGGRLYIANAPGTVECLDATTGNPIWKERVSENLWGSLLLAKDRLYVTDLTGATHVLASGAKFEVLARNDLNEATYAAPAVANGEMFIRTYEHLYCIGAKK
jgi:outer membrane protein assembly factor BamB